MWPQGYSGLVTGHQALEKLGCGKQKVDSHPSILHSFPKDTPPCWDPYSAPFPVPYPSCPQPPSDTHGGLYLPAAAAGGGGCERARMSVVPSSVPFSGSCPPHFFEPGTLTGLKLTKSARLLPSQSLTLFSCARITIVSYTPSSLCESIELIPVCAFTLPRSSPRALQGDLQGKS